METLAAVEYPALAEIEPNEARFLALIIRDGVRQATAKGRVRAQFHEYVFAATRVSLGARLVSINWNVSRYGVPVASDCSIQYR